MAYTRGMHIFGRPSSAKGEGGVPPFSAKKKSVKNWPKNSVFWAKNAVFSEFLASRRPLRGGGGYPPFPLRKNLLRIGPRAVFFGQKMPFSANFWRAAVR